MASADIFFGGLPAEILSDVAALLPVVDIVRLAMTCRVMHALTTCQAMWHRLFVRDFAHLYNKGLAVQSWPHSDHPDDPWHVMAIELWRGTDVVSVMPPRCRPLEGLPPPFAHAFAAGKDWRWLYRAHLTTSSEPPDESFSGPRSQRLDPSTLGVADWASGSSVGYTAEIIFGGHNGDEVVSWTEFTPAQAPDDCYWSVECTATSVTHRGATDASGIIRSLSFRVLVCATGWPSTRARLAPLPACPQTARATMVGAVTATSRQSHHIIPMGAPLSVQCATAEHTASVGSHMPTATLSAPITLTACWQTRLNLCVLWRVRGQNGQGAFSPDVHGARCRSMSREARHAPLFRSTTATTLVSFGAMSPRASSGGARARGASSWTWSAPGLEHRPARRRKHRVIK
ncbi:F-box domain protein [Pandoravirus inopinatum]|uniref:F-box domain protein n=1 Tax=Pandoravirus inopinatum TaxID=1605721 RepID=A0A0B5J7W1_9VIRU|nr:F-box domain protein [Pandoravirus inopinatum]AJF96866.1 F-box domain protein [Pandoravirus inopinatum]